MPSGVNWHINIIKFSLALSSKIDKKIGIGIDKDFFYTCDIVWSDRGLSFSLYWFEYNILNSFKQCKTELYSYITAN